MDFELLDAIPDAILVSDAQGRLTYVNRMTSELFGYEPGALVGRPMDVLIPSRFRAAHALHQDDYFAAPRSRPMGLGLPLVGLKQDGTEFPVDISLAPLGSARERSVVAVVRDITLRKQMEERERQMAKAVEEVRRRDEVLAIASHELRAPVGSLQLQVGALHRAATATATELNAMRDRMASAAAELTAMRERMGKVERHSGRLARLVAELLEELDLAELARDTASSLREEVEREGSVLTVVADAPVLGRWDPVRLEQVLANLLLNAGKFGMGKPISLRVDGGDELARLVVEDAGMGIAIEDQERIFERFERAAEAGAVLGLGLGLYIARRLVEAHGGTLRVRSTSGSGSVFTVEIPRAPPAAA
jgi:PAS domain S-box-containing protein